MADYSSLTSDDADLVDDAPAVRSGLGVLCPTGPDEASRTALVGIAATDRGEMLFDTVDRSECS